MNLPFTTPEKAAEYKAKEIWTNLTIYQMFAEAASRNPEKTAVIDGDIHYSYGEMSRLINNLAGNLHKIGISSGDIVAVQIPNSAYMPIVNIALNRIGAIYLPIHDGWREAEMSHLLGKSGARMIVVINNYRDFDYTAMLQQMQPQLPDLEWVYSLDGTGNGSLAFEDLLLEHDISNADLDALSPDPDLPAGIMPSSGTTSLPKMSVFSNNNLIFLLNRCFGNTIDLSENDVAAALAPAGTGSTGYILPVIAPLLKGGTSVILQHWGNPKDALELIVKHRCTYATGIPTQMTMLLEFLDDYSAEDFASFTRFNNAGAPLPHETGRLIEEKMNCKIHVVYGATDGGVPTMTQVNTDTQDQRLYSVGQVLPDCLVELWDANDEKVPSGGVGEIVWSTPGKSYGYFNDDAETEAAWSANGFFKSGDLGQIDENGYLSIVGRVKDMILRGGRNISPRTVEELLIKHAAVKQVAVTAMPDPRLGERACAFIELHDGHSLSFEQMVDYLNEQKIAKWEFPERLETVTEWPISGGGKIQKNKLTEMVTKKLKAEGVLPE